MLAPRRLASIGVVSALLLAPMTSASASPGVRFASAAASAPAPSAPVLLFRESFENGLGASDATTVGGYTGADGETYGSDPYWAETSECNGIVLSAQSTDAQAGAVGCVGPASVLRELAEAIGSMNGSPDATANHAVTAFSADDDSPANAVEFKTLTPLSIPVTSRFLVFGANVAAWQCGASAEPELRFYLADGSTEIPTNDAAQDPCTLPSAAPWSGSAQFTTATVRSDRAVLFTGQNIGIVMRNEQTSYFGDDHAFDDLQVWDATPRLTMTFDKSNGTVGAPVNLVFTVTNTSDLAAKDGWRFSDRLPSGIVVAGSPSTGCGTGTTLSAAKGATTLSVTKGQLAAGVASCTITVPVKAVRAGTFTNGPTQMTRVGLDAPGRSTYQADPSSPVLSTTAKHRVDLPVKGRGTTKRIAVRDHVKLSNFLPGGTARGLASLYGPVTRVSASTCDSARLVATVRFRPHNGRLTTPPVSVSRPGHYTWVVRTTSDDRNRAVSDRCGLPAESLVAHRPTYHAPVVNTGFDGIPAGRAGRHEARKMPVGRVRVPALGISAPVLAVHRHSGQMLIPADVHKTGWLRDSAATGDRIGTVVIAGHVSDRRDRPGSLKGLRRARTGQIITAVTPTGRRMTYRITAIASQSRTKRLPQPLFSTSGAPRLVLITCTGRVTYPNGHFHYTRNLIVVAKPV